MLEIVNLASLLSLCVILEFPMSCSRDQLVKLLLTPSPLFFLTQTEHLSTKCVFQSFCNFLLYQDGCFAVTSCGHPAQQLQRLETLVKNLFTFSCSCINVKEERKYSSDLKLCISTLTLCVSSRLSRAFFGLQFSFYDLRQTVYKKNMQTLAIPGYGIQHSVIVNLLFYFIMDAFLRAKSPDLP